MINFLSNKQLKMLLVGVLTSHIAIAQENAEIPKGPTNDEVIYESYREYLKASQDYIATQKEASEQVRDWRKKRLAEIFNERLDSTEKNLLLSNSNLIDEFSTFLKQNGVDSFDDVLLIRLAQLYFEKANLEFNQLMKKNQESGAAAEIPVPNYRKAILFSKLFIAKFPNSPIGDKAYYLLGFSSEEMGNAKESVFYYEGLLKHYPASEFAEEVSWRLGEIYYSDMKYTKSEEMYQRLSKVNGVFYTKALYKLGATYFVQKKLTQAVQIFQKLISEISKYQNKSLEDQSILDESLDYLATILSNDSKIQIASEYQSEVYYRLGLLYKKRLDEKSMRTVFIDAVQRFPSAKQLPHFYSELIDSFESAQDYEKANAYRSQFVQILTQDQKWWTQNEDYKNIVFRTQDLLEFSLIKSAEYYAERGYSNNDMSQLQIAKNRYYNFITKYTWSSYKDYAKLELADLEYFLNNYAQASNYYFEIVSEATSATLREEAAYSLIWSESKKVGYNLNFESISAAPRNIQKTNLSPEEKVFSRAAVFYITKIPSSARRNKVIYKLAELYADRGDIEASAQYLNMIISDTENPSSIAVHAHRFLMDLYNIKNDWTSLVSVGELYGSTFFIGDVDALDKENFKQKYRDKLETASNFELEQKYLEAAQGLEKIIIQNPRNPMVDFLSLKIMSLYIRTGQYDRAMGVSGRLASTKFKAEAQFLKSYIYYKTVRFEEAVKTLEEFATQNKKHPWFEEAILDIISLRSQMKEEEKTAEFLKKLNPENFSAHTYYSYIQVLLNTKKFDDLYRAVNATKGKSKYDSYRMQYFASKAQHDRYDYVGLSRTCESIDKALSSRPTRTAYGTLNKSFCEYVKLKTTVGQSDISLDDTVSRLNSIYSLKIDFVTTLALNEIITKSELKNNFRSQFEQLIQKGWSIAKLYPLSEETQRLSQTILNYSGKLPLSLAYMLNWKMSVGDLFDFQIISDKSGKWKTVGPLCESKQYQECLVGLKEIQSENPNLYAVYENLILVSLRLSHDEELQKWTSAYIKEAKANERSQIFAYYLGMQDMIPESSKGVLALATDAMGTSAKALEHLSKKDYKNAIDTLINALESHPDSVYPYYVLTQVYYDRGFADLARTVAMNGYINTNNKALLPFVYQLNAVTFSNTSTKNIEIRRDQSPAELFAIGFAALKNKDVETLDKVYKATKNEKPWFEAIKTLELVYTNSNKFKADDKSNNFYTQWLQALYRLARGQDEFSLDKIDQLAQKNQFVPNYRGIERMISNREVAGDRK